MAPTPIQRHALIRAAVLSSPGNVVSTTIVLWEKLAAGLIAIIGESGFQALYARSLHLAAGRYPFLATHRPLHRAGSRFDDLKASLEQYGATDAGEASISLLITFLDILTLLIGELLTNSILRAAWGDAVFEPAGKEPPT